MTSQGWKAPISNREASVSTASLLAGSMLKPIRPENVQKMINPAIAARISTVLTVARCHGGSAIQVRARAACLVDVSSCGDSACGSDAAWRSADWLGNDWTSLDHLAGDCLPTADFSPCGFSDLAIFASSSAS